MDRLSVHLISTGDLQVPVRFFPLELDPARKVSLSVSTTYIKRIAWKLLSLGNVGKGTMPDCLYAVET
jgi:hypothetical protein